MKRFTSFLLLITLVISTYALETITVDGLQRTMIVHVPSGLPDGAPLVISCHGMNQDANYQAYTNSQWIAVADTAKFVVVFPNGINKGWDLGGTENKDTDFMKAIIAEMQSRHGINTNRVYLTGFSMGGMFTYFCANNIPECFAAFCPVSGYPMGDKSVHSSRPVPIFHSHGTGDDVCVFSGVQPTLDNWISRNQCNPVPEVTSPYPSTLTWNGAQLTRWTGGLDGTEVVLLQFEGKGHWQSEDANICMTSVEAWRFMRRWSLGPEAPKVESIEPEDGSFDLPQDGLEIKLTFDENISADGVEASLTSASKTCNLQAEADGQWLILTVPSGVVLPKGIYRLNVSGVKGDAGGTLKSFTAEYVIGIEDVGEQLSVATILNPDWRAEQSAVGEGIPTGWHRINSASDGRTDERGSGEGWTGGARMKYFIPGGDFDEGFYLSARDYDRCEISYGRYDTHRLHLAPGRYTIEFNSIYWNEGSMTGAHSFDYSLSTLDGTPVTAAKTLRPTGNLDENSSQTITGSNHHTFTVDIDTDGDYIFAWQMSQGWAAVIVGNLKITTAASASDRYKGEFQRLYTRANDFYRSLTTQQQATPEAVTLKAVLDKYQDLVSTAPSVYTAAINELTAAFEALQQSLSGLETIKVDDYRKIEYISPQGITRLHPVSGLNIVKTTAHDGTVTVTKQILK